MEQDKGYWFALGKAAGRKEIIEELRAILDVPSKEELEEAIAMAKEAMQHE